MSEQKCYNMKTLQVKIQKIKKLLIAVKNVDYNKKLLVLYEKVYK
jgi:hypothetical protein